MEARKWSTVWRWQQVSVASLSLNRYVQVGRIIELGSVIHPNPFLFHRYRQWVMTEGNDKWEALYVTIVVRERLAGYQVNSIEVTVKEAQTFQPYPRNPRSGSWNFWADIKPLAERSYYTVLLLSTI